MRRTYTSTYLRVNTSSTQEIVAYATYYTHIVTLRRFRVTIVAVEISISYSEFESSIQHVKLIRNIVICGLPAFTIFFHIIS